MAEDRFAASARRMTEAAIDQRIAKIESLMCRSAQRLLDVARNAARVSSPAGGAQCALPLGGTQLVDDGSWRVRATIASV